MANQDVQRPMRFRFSRKAARNQLAREREVNLLGGVMKALSGPATKQAATSTSGTTLLRVDK